MPRYVALDVNAFNAFCCNESMFVVPISGGGYVYPAADAADANIA
jgi:hypothetical protein